MLINKNKTDIYISQVQHEGDCKFNFILNTGEKSSQQGLKSYSIQKKLTKLQVFYGKFDCIYGFKFYYEDILVIEVG